MASEWCDEKLKFETIIYQYFKRYIPESMNHNYIGSFVGDSSVSNLRIFLMKFSNMHICIFKHLSHCLTSLALDKNVWRAT